MTMNKQILLEIISIKIKYDYNSFRNTCLHKYRRDAVKYNILRNFFVKYEINEQDIPFLIDNFVWYNTIKKINYN